MSVDKVIDLTLSDSEDSSPPFRAPQFRPLEETPAGEPSGAALPDRGLLLDRELGSFNRWGLGRAAGFLSHRLLKGGPSRLRRRITSKSSARSTEHAVLPSIRQVPDYHTSSAKRRRIKLDITYHNQEREHGDDLEQIPRRPQIGVAEKTPGTGPLLVGSQSTSAKAPQAPQQGRGGNEISKDAMNECLKIALRQQVFPHVNQRLGHYRLSIDNATRKQLSKKVDLFSSICPLGHLYWSGVADYELGCVGYLWRGLHEQPDAK
jgi:hypothetical protein